MVTTTIASHIQRTVSLIYQISADIVNFFRIFYGREIPPDPVIWHRRSLFRPVRTVEGTMETEVWRRLTPHGWEYSRYNGPHAAGAGAHGGRR
jgi:hypothetical protein